MAPDGGGREGGGGMLSTGGVGPGALALVDAFFGLAGAPPFFAGGGLTGIGLPLRVFCSVGGTVAVGGEVRVPSPTEGGSPAMVPGALVDGWICGSPPTEDGWPTTVDGAAPT